MRTKQIVSLNIESTSVNLRSLKPDALECEVFGLVDAQGVRVEENCNSACNLLQAAEALPDLSFLSGDKKGPASSASRDNSFHEAGNLARTLFTGTLNPARVHKHSCVSSFSEGPP